MLLMGDGTEGLAIVNLDHLEALWIRDPKTNNPEEYAVACRMVSGEQVILFRGNKSECAAIVWGLQGSLASVPNQDVLQMSQLIPDANGDVR